MTQFDKYRQKLFSFHTFGFLFIMVFGTNQCLAQCSIGQSEVFIDITTDNWGYECYWELLQAGDTCGGNFMFQGGNMGIGCNGGCAQTQSFGGYADNITITEGPWCLQEGNTYNIVYVDDFGDGGATFEVYVSGQLTSTFFGAGCGGAFSFMVLPPLLLDSSNLPIVVLNTNGQVILDDPKITIDMGVIDNGPGQMNYMSDPFNDYHGMIGIEYRGSSSQSFPKKSYGLETRDVFGNELNAPIMGMPAESDWVLYAPYSDKSLLRNVLTFNMGSKLGSYSPRTRLCELVVDNSYKGVYVFMEKIKRGNTRVDIAELTLADTLGDQLTGGYIIKIDKNTGGGDGWISPYLPDSSGIHNIYFQYDYPDWKYILPEQKNYIQNFMFEFESALKGADFLSTTTGYSQYVDLNSFADFLIMNELSNNVDGYRLSAFMYKNKDSKGGKLTMGPLWDFNLAFGNADYCNGGNTNGWAYDFNSVCPNDNWQIPFWWERMMQDTFFVNVIKCRWENLRLEKFHTDTMMSYIDSMANYLDLAQQRNFNTWSILGTYVWPNNFIGNTYQEEIDYLKSWTSDRLNWLDSNISGICHPYITSNENMKNRDFSLYPVSANEFLYLELPMNSNNGFDILFFNQFGNMVSEEKAQSKNEKIIINTRTWPSGIYICLLHTNNKIISRKFIVTH